MAYTRSAALMRTRRPSSHDTLKGASFWQNSRAVRRGLWYDPALERVADPARYLMAPSTRFHQRMARAVRAIVLLAASFTMTPALPALIG